MATRAFPKCGDLGQAAPSRRSSVRGVQPLACRAYILPHPSPWEMTLAAVCTRHFLYVVAPSQQVCLCTRDHHGRIGGRCDVLVVVWREPFPKEGVDAEEYSIGPIAWLVVYFEARVEEGLHQWRFGF